MLARNRTKITVAAWAAIIAIAFNALWPLLAQLKPGAPAPLLVAGAAYEHSSHHPSQGSSGQTDPGPLTPHCAFCSLSAGWFAIGTAHRSDFSLPADVLESRPALSASVSLAFPDYRRANPRAPPVVL